MVLDSVLSIWASAWCITAIAVLALVQPRPWHLPQYWIPLLGMMLHNTLTGISLGLDRLTRELTGQLLAGVDPVQAVMYQMVIMFLIAAATSLGTVGVVLLGYRRLFNPQHQFLPARIRRRP